MRRSRTTKAISMLQTMYNRETDSWEAYQDPYFGLYIVLRSDIPVSDCDMARTLWTSDSADVYRKKKGVPKEVSDIIRVGGQNDDGQAVPLALKEGTTICVRHARRTAVSEIYMIELHRKDDHLDIPPLHPDDSTKLIHVKSVIMTTATSAELALDQDLALVSYRLCLQAREIQIGKLQQIAQGADHIFQDPHGNPTLSVKAGEGTYVFQCTKVPTILRASTECCQELAVSVAGQDLFMKVLTKRLTHHCTARACSSTLPAVFNLGSAERPSWVKVGQSGVPHPAPVPAKFTQKDVFLRVGVPIITDSGLYTDEQRKDMMLQAQRQDAILQVVAHLTHTVVSKANMWETHTTQIHQQEFFKGS